MKLILEPWEHKTTWRKVEHILSWVAGVLILLGLAVFGQMT